MTVSIEKLLNIGGLEVEDLEIGEQRITIRAKISSNFTKCHKCGKKATEYYSDGETVELRHLPICERPVYIYLRTKRYRCQNCEDGPTTTQHGDWYDLAAHCTKAYAKSLLREMVGSTLAEVARKQEINYGILRGLLEREVSEGVDWRELTQLRVLGLDEISLLKGHQDFVTVVSSRDDLGRPVILGVLEGREKETVKAFLQSIPEHLRATVEEVCTDMYKGFTNAVAEVLPAARVVADRFHVAKGYRAALDELRKTEMHSLKAALTPDEYAGLKGVIWALRRNHQDLTDEELQLLDLLFECSPVLRRGYQLREKLTDIFETAHTKQSAERALRRWMAEVRSTGLTCFDSFLITLENWMDQITNYFLSRLTSGWVEGLNNKIKVIKRRCYGIPNPVTLFRRLWLDLNGLDAFAA
ncbi:MAG: ISL3 family transposase [Blastocatellales bacterium]|nr:ISL3 family transposase [Blastocatellales bacterium]